jgi:hypothetical protein
MNSNPTRRDFGKAAGLTALALATSTSPFLLSGCNVITDIENWVPIAQASVNSLEAILTTNGINVGPVTAVLNDIQAGLAAVLGAAQQYAATTPAPVGALQKIEAAFQAVVANFGKFLTQLNLPGGGLLNLISALVGLVLSTIAGFINRLPTPPAGFTVSFSVKTPGGFLTVVPKSRSRREYKKDFNSQIDAGATAGVKIPAGAKLHVSFFEHF